MPEEPSELFAQTRYQIQHQLGLLKEKFKVQDETGNPMMWVTTPSISLKKEFHVYSDEAGTQEVLSIKTHKLMEIAETWDVSDPVTQQSIGTIKAEPLKSVVAPNWKILNSSGQEIAVVAENTAERLENTVVGGLVPRKFAVTTNGATLGQYNQSYTGLVMHFDMDFSSDAQHTLDRRLGLAAGVIVANKALTENRDEHHGITPFGI